MKALPNPSVSLVDADGRPTSSLLEIVPKLSAIDVVVDAQGLATPLFRARLERVARTPLPSMAAQLTDRDGRPTRVLTALLGAL